MPTPDAALCFELESLLTAHDAKEEGVLGVYAECERLFSPGETQQLANKAAAFPVVRVVRHFHGPGVRRTAALALAAVARMKRRT